MSWMLDCRHFNGYKPCGYNSTCDRSCRQYQRSGLRLAVIQLGAMGAVLRATCILKPLRRKFPQAEIYWITDRNAKALLEHNPYIDRLIDSRPEEILKLKGLEFDGVFCLDKDLRAGGIASELKTGARWGFSSSEGGAILPLNQEARELWELGLDDHKKFYINQKPETQLITEALGLEYRRDPYSLFLTPEEWELSYQRKNSWSDYGRKPVVGLNTGCANVIPHKKLSFSKQLELIQSIEREFSLNLVLLGGPEDREWNHKLAELSHAIPSPCSKGLRDGMCSIAACDLVISGDSLGMHISIALQKYTLAWFGATCAQEIDLYDRGRKLKSKMPCSPCWKRSCTIQPRCDETVDLVEILSALRQFLNRETQTGIDLGL